MINTERILTDYQNTWSWINPISKIIEAVVTNNVGYDFKAPRIFEEGTNVRQVLLTGQEITDPDWLNTQWCLKDLRSQWVLPLHSERDKRLPLISSMEVNIINFDS